MKAYNEYKASGMEWIGEIPSHWDVLKIKSLCTNIFAGATPSTAVEEYWNGTLPWIPSGCCHDCLISEAPKFITQAGVDNSSTKLIPANNTVMAMTGATCAQLGFVTFDTYANQSVAAFIANPEKVLSKFLFYALFSARNYVLSFQTGGAQAGISIEECSNLIIPGVPLNEQRAIVNFLDGRVSTIDSIIREKTDLLNDLSEYRRTLINEVVSQGVAGQALSVETGVHSFERIPTGWLAMKIKYALVQDKDGIKIGPFGSSLTNKVSDCGPVKVYGQWNIVDKNFLNGKNYVQEETFEALNGYEVVPGDVLVSMMGTVGKCATIPTGIQKGIMDSHVIKIRLNHSLILNEYFELVYDKDNSNIVFSQINELKKGSIMDGLNSTIVKNLYIPLPPLAEQKLIVEAVKKKTKTIDKAISEVNQQLIDLEEYKASVIFEAVTGKIDLRQ